MREQLRSTVGEKVREDRAGMDLEVSNVYDGMIYLVPAIPLMLFDYTMERLGYETNLTTKVLDFLRDKCGITTRKLLQGKGL